MAQNFKKAVQNALLMPRKKQYEKDYIRLLKEYEDQSLAVFNYVSSKEVEEETAKVVERLSMETLVKNLKNHVVYDESRFYIIYDPTFGILRKESERLIYEYLLDNPYAALIYGDEDYFALSADFKEEELYKARRAFRYYKPVFSPETLASFDYINAFAIEGSFLNDLLASTEMLSASIYYTGMMYELTVEACAKLRADRREDLICHIPAVLVSKGIEIDTDEKEINESFETGALLYPEYQKIIPALSDDKYSAIRQKAKEKLKLIPVETDITVSVIIPSKDNPDMLTSLIGKLNLAGLKKIEVIIVDNGSSEENKAKVEAFLEKCDFEYKYIYAVEEFNYSKMNNVGAKVARGEVLLLLNDDIEAEGYEWIRTMASYATNKGVGCVGCKLLYPDGKIQHVGISAGIDGPAHKFMGEEDSVKAGAGDNLVNKNVLAVTGACLAVRKELYDRVGGLYEELKVGYNDVDLCMNLYENGYRNVLLNDIKLIHHESVSRGVDAKNKVKSERLSYEKAILKNRHPSLMIVDPYEGGSADFKLKFEKEKEDLSINASGKFESRKSNDEEGWVYFSFEKFEVKITEDEHKILVVKGYAVVPGIDNMRFDFDVILQKDGKQFVIPTERSLRPDLAGRFNGSENTELCGIDLRVSVDNLEEGNYRIYMYAKDHGNVREIITDTFLNIDI